MVARLLNHPCFHFKYVNECNRILHSSASIDARHSMLLLLRLETRRREAYSEKDHHRSRYFYDYSLHGVFSYFECPNLTSKKAFSLPFMGRE